MNLLENNIRIAKSACDAVYGIEPFKTLNKPTHSQMLFQPNGTLFQGFQELHRFPDGTSLGLCPVVENWLGVPERDQTLHKEIKKQRKDKFNREWASLKNNISLPNNEIVLGYVSNLLESRIGFFVVDTYKAGNCGELVGYCTIYLLTEKQQSKINFNSLEIIEFSSRFEHLDENNNERPYTHVVGVIDRDLKNSVHNLYSWGEKRSCI